MVVVTIARRCNAWLQIMLVAGSALSSKSALFVPSVTKSTVCSNRHGNQCLNPMKMHMLPYESPTGFVYQEQSLSTFVVGNSQMQQMQSNLGAPNQALREGVSMWLSATTSGTAIQPSNQEVTLLREAFGELYGTSDPDYEKSISKFTEVIKIWTKKQLPADEVSGLYRIRADCYMKINNAQLALSDYDTSVKLLEKALSKTDTEVAFDDDDDDDFESQQQQQKNELSIALLGRARAAKNLAYTSTTIASRLDMAKQASLDYERALILSSREDWDTTAEYVTDGAIRNPYAAWEYGTVLQWQKQYKLAGSIHALASSAFAQIGDKARSVISLTDSGIDYAMAAAEEELSLSTSTTNNNNNNNNKPNKNNIQQDSPSTQQAKAILIQAIAATPGIVSNRGDVELLQRVIVKEGEGRVALAALLWNSGEKQLAETYYGDACLRLEQLQAQIDTTTTTTTTINPSQSISSSSNPVTKTKQSNSVAKASTSTTTSTKSIGVLYSIDDEIVQRRTNPNSNELLLVVSCNKYKNKDFLTNTLLWPETLQELIVKFETLQI